MDSFDWKTAALVAGGVAVSFGVGVFVGLRAGKRDLNEGEEAAEAAHSALARDSANRVAVFCGSSTPSGPSGAAMLKAAEALGKAIPNESMELVFGGGNIGLMGTIARAVDASGGNVRGVIPRALAAREVSGTPVQPHHEIVVSTMHERKMLMASLSAGFIAMPGGFGTMEEVLEAITWTQLSIHSKPVGLLNVDGFWDPLLRQIDEAVREGLIQEAMKSIVVVDADPVALLRKIRAWKPREDSQLRLAWSHSGDKTQSK